MEAKTVFIKLRHIYLVYLAGQIPFLAITCSSSDYWIIFPLCLSTLQFMQLSIDIVVRYAIRTEGMTE